MANRNYDEPSLPHIDGFCCLPCQCWMRIDFRRVGCLIEWSTYKIKKYTSISGQFWESTSTIKQNQNWDKPCFYPIDRFHCLPCQNQTRIDFRRVDLVQGCLIEWFKVQFGKWPILSGYLWKDGKSQLWIAFFTIYRWMLVFIPTKSDKNWLRGMRFGMAEISVSSIIVVGVKVKCACRFVHVHAQTCACTCTNLCMYMHISISSC
jgi:hypothetical protein